MARHAKGIRYVRRLTVPKAVPPGKVLVHNQVQHEKDTPCGWNGFRAWTQTSRAGLVLCSCGWAGLKHYRVKANLP